MLWPLQNHQLYRNLYRKMFFWPQWRNADVSKKFQMLITGERKELFTCGFFCSFKFHQGFLLFHYQKWVEFPFTADFSMFHAWNMPTKKLISGKVKGTQTEFFSNFERRKVNLYKKYKFFTNQAPLHFLSISEIS